MFTRAIHLLGLIATGGLCSAAVVSSTPAHRWPRALSVHEWGTFTTVAGENGAAVDWLPLGGPADLPCFVEHFQDRRTVKVVPAPGAVPLDYQAARAALLGKVRMETPVLYVYAPHDTTLDVRVRFPRGLMTEWYPHAAVTQTVAGPNTLRTPSQASAIEWQDVRVRPRARASSFPTGEGDSHYYAARATDASPVTVNGQTEKFLFYRGIADFDAPITAAAIASGRVRVTNVSGTDVPALVLFERRGAKLGYRVMGSLRGETTVNAPVLDGSIGALHSHLEAILVAAGRFRKKRRRWSIPGASRGSRTGRGCSTSSRRASWTPCCRSRFDPRPITSRACSWGAWRSSTPRRCAPRSARSRRTMRGRSSGTGASSGRSPTG